MVKLTNNLTSEEFKQYYFLKEELKDFCRSEGLKVSGSKQELENRIIHYLSTGEKLNEPVVRKKSNTSSSEFTLDSRLGENFKCRNSRSSFKSG